jgi:RNA polymerase sigma-70 factor (ECF subfamily)
MALRSNAASSVAAGRVECRAHDAALDAALVVRARAGDTESFGMLVRRHLPAVYAVARAVVVEPADAEDVCQDTFVNAFTHLADCEPPEQFRAWLLQSARNRAISLIRRQNVRIASVLGTGPGESDVPSPMESPLAAAERMDLGARLRSALAELSSAQRTVVLLHDVDGWSHRDIAALLGVAEGTSRSTLFDARRRLRALLAPLLEPARPARTAEVLALHR